MERASMSDGGPVGPEASLASSDARRDSSCGSELRGSSYKVMRSESSDPRGSIADSGVRRVASSKTQGRGMDSRASTDDEVEPKVALNRSLAPSLESRRASLADRSEGVSPSHRFHSERDPRPNSGSVVRVLSSQIARMSSASSERRTLTWPTDALYKDDREVEMDASLNIRDPDLLRAVPARTVLSGLGKVLCSSQGNERDFEQSHPTDNIEVFLSHCWQTPGWLKTASLLYVNNLRVAIAASILTQVLVQVPEVLGAPCYRLYVVQAYVPDGAGISKFYIVAHFIPGLVVFWLALLLGHHLPIAGQQRWFLDKLCIHQVDAEKKKAGVHMLGAFLRHSDRMLVLWDPEYFQRVWCVFEVAAFLYVRKEKANLQFLPVQLPAVALALHLFHTCTSVAVFLLGPMTIFCEWHAQLIADHMIKEVHVLYMMAVTGLFAFLMYVLPAFPLWWFARKYMADRQAELEQLQRFTFAAARCTCEDDRVFVKAKIVSWFGSIETFEGFVRGGLCERVSSMLLDEGPIPYCFVLVGSLPHLQFAAAGTFYALYHGDTQLFLRYLWATISMWMFTDALAMNLTMRWARPSSWGTRSAECHLWGCLRGPVALGLLFALASAVPMGLSLPSVPVWVGAAVLPVKALIIWMLYQGAPELLPAESIMGLRRSSSCGSLTEGQAKAPEDSWLATIPSSAELDADGGDVPSQTSVPGTVLEQV